jgi:hypothetical protein
VLTPELRRRRSAYANSVAARNRNPGPAADAAVDRAYAAYQFEALAETIQRTIESTPTLSESQVDRLCGLIRGGVA